jgi:VanZ family protein
VPLSTGLSYGHLAISVNRRAAAFWLLYLAVILYLSLYPWRFSPHPFARTLPWIPFFSRRVILDACLNVLFYIPLGASAFLAMRRSVAAMLAATILAILVSFSVEMAQLSIPGRYGNLTDLFSNSVGASLGAVGAFLATRPLIASRLVAFCTPGSLLLFLWTIWHAFNFVLPRTWSAADAGPEIAGVFVLVAIRMRPVRPFAAPLLLAWLVLDELRPFQFHQPPQPFGWLPFVSWFAGATESYYGIIFGKLFLYTAVVWLLRERSLRWFTAVAIPSVILAVGETAQRYLHGRTPETTDLALLAAGAFLLECVYDNKD